MKNMINTIVLNSSNNVNVVLIAIVLLYFIKS